MTSNDIFNQPAEQVREYWQTLLQHKWQVYFTTLALTLAAIVGISLLPDQYQVTTTILVDPQKVPDEYIPATIKSPLGCAKTVRAGTTGLNFQSPPFGLRRTTSPLESIP